MAMSETMLLPFPRIVLPRSIYDYIRVDEEPHPVLGTPCWHWMGRKNRNGYGRTYLNGHEPVAHRAVYELLVGPIPPKMILDHKCKNRGCVNPEHTEPVTHRENTLRGGAVLFQRLESYAIPTEESGESATEGPKLLGFEGDRIDRPEGERPGDNDRAVDQEPSGTEGHPGRLAESNPASEGVRIIADMNEDLQNTKKHVRHSLLASFLNQILFWGTATAIAVYGVALYCVLRD